MEFLLPPVINEEGKKYILQHKYRAGVKSFLMPYLDVWWEFAVQFIPRWFAPNCLTLCSFFSGWASFLVFAYYDPSFSGTFKSAPFYLFHFMMLFIYQTTDAIDGKHARNTQNSSPLGQLFDHGCDAFAITLLTAMHVAMTEVGSSWVLLYCLVAGQIVFYALNWRARHTGVFDFGQFAVDETFILGQFNYLMAAYYGPWMSFELPFGMQLWQLLVGGLSCCIIHHCINAAHEVNRYYERVSDQSGDSTQLRRFYDERFYELANVVVFHCSLFAWNAVGIVAVNPWLFIMTITMTFAHLAHRLIICDVTQQKSRRIQYIIIPFVVIGALSLMERLMGTTVIGELSMSDERVLIGTAIYNGYFMSAYAIRCMLDISNVLDIYIFRYNEPKKKDKKES